MAEEVHMDAEAAIRHADKAALLPWCPLDPCAALIAQEEGDAEGEMDPHANVFDQLLAFLFADEHPECWPNVAMRALAIMRHCVPSLLTGRDLSEAADLRARANVQQCFRLTEFVEACESAAFRGLLSTTLRYLFPDDRGWLAEGCRRTYLVARAYRPEYLAVWRAVPHQVKFAHRDEQGKVVRVERKRRETPEECEANYHDLARIFGEPAETKEDRKKARARWSARAQRVLRRTIEAAGGTMHLQFGKSASTRRKCAEKARGNQNRKKA